MKKTQLLPLLTLPAFALTLSAVTPLGVWHTSDPVSISRPLMLDSADVKGKPFDPASLLTSVRHLPDTHTTLKSDTIRPDLPAEGLAIYQYSTRIRAPRFAKGEISVHSSAPFALLMDGKQQGEVKPGGDTPVKQALTLNPEQSYNIDVRVLCSATDSVAPAIAVSWEPTKGFEHTDIITDIDSPRRFMLDDTMFGPRVTDAKVSPDGRWLLSNYSDMTDIDRTLSRTTLTDLRTGRQHTIASHPDMAWMPVSSRLYFTERGEQGTDLMELDPTTMTTRVIASNVPEQPMEFNLTEDRLYYNLPESPDPQQGPVKRVTSPAERIPGGNARSNLHEFDPATGIDRPLTFGARNLAIVDFHPDGRRLLVMSVTETPTRRPFAEMGLYELDTRTLSLDTIVPPTSMISDATYSPDASHLAIVGAPDLFNGIGKNYGAHPEGNEYDRQLYLLDLRSNTPEAVSIDFTPSIASTPVWHSDGRLYFTADEGFETPLYSYDRRSRTFTRLPMPAGVTNVRRMDMPATSHRLVFTGQGPEMAGGVYAYDTKTRKTTEIDNPLAARLADIEMAKGEQWQFTASDGTLIDGYIFLPPGFDASRKYPLIVYYYGGTLPSQHGISSPYSPQVFASRDYVVYVLNPSGTPGYGQEFSARHANAWGKRTAEDIIEGTKQFIKEHPFVDPAKVGCIGASYGGFMTQYLQTLTPMFAAAVSHAGISDVTSYWGEGYWGYSYNAVAAPDSYPWNNPELFTRQGSLFNADKIHTPLLLLHGTADTNVPIGESIQLYNALKILDRPVELVTVDGENHFISDYAKRRRWQDTIMAWFARYLQDDSSWWNALYH